jgi:hypothetical protein
MRSRLYQRLLTILHAPPQFAAESIAPAEAEGEPDKETESAATF